MKNVGLTKRETQIMNVLWKSSKPMSAYDILMASPDLSRNTIQIVLKKLQATGFIEVAGVGYHKNALTRVFQPIISQSEYMEESLSDSAAYDLAKSFVQATKNVASLEELAQLIQERKEYLATLPAPEVEEASEEDNSHVEPVVNTED